MNALVRLLWQLLKDERLARAWQIGRGVFVLIVLAAAILIPGFVAVKLLRRYGWERPFLSLAIHFTTIPLFIICIIAASAFLPMPRPNGYTAFVTFGLALLGLSLIVTGLDVLNIIEKKK